VTTDNSYTSIIKDFANCDHSAELDRLKDIQDLIESFNENQSFHYLLRLKIGLRRAWYSK
jgi:hypothetical protein